jgi:hypothetical protein
VSVSPAQHPIVTAKTAMPKWWINPEGLTRYIPHRYCHPEPVRHRAICPPVAGREGRREPRKLLGVLAQPSFWSAKGGVRCQVAVLHPSCPPRRPADFCMQCHNSARGGVRARLGQQAAQAGGSA